MLNISKISINTFLLCIVLIQFAVSDHVSHENDYSVPINIFQTIQLKSRLKNGHNPFDKLTVQEKFKLKNNFENYLIEFLNKSIIQSRNSYKINKQCEKNLREFLDSLLSFEPWSLAGTLLFQNIIF